jgi:hypothetical protein
MLSPRLTNCPECANIPSLLKKIDCKLAELGNNLYNNISYMLNKPVPADDMLQLIGYRRILTHKLYNYNYVSQYSISMIASRVIRLTSGCVSKCNEPERCLEEPCNITIVPNPTTTSTSTLAPITTTTSTTLTPTTTTTSSSSTSTTTSTSSSSSTTTTTTIAPINPDDIAGLWAWYKGDVGIVGTSQVTAWEDQSGLTNDLLTNLTYYPEAVSDTVGTLPTTVIKKVNYATLANMSTAANFPNTSATGVTLFVVGKVITSPGALNYIIKAPNTELYSNSAPSMNSKIGQGSALNQGISLNTYYTFRNNTDLIDQYFSINGNVPLNEALIPPFYIASPFRIFSQNGPVPLLSEQGDMAYAEIIIYNTVLTPTEINDVELYLKNKYNHY